MPDQFGSGVSDVLQFLTVFTVRFLFSLKDVSFFVPRCNGSVWTVEYYHGYFQDSQLCGLPSL